LDKLSTLPALLDRALNTLEDALNAAPDALARDAAIQRFEYSFELTWKLVKIWMKKGEGIVCNSPKACFRKAAESGLLNEEEAVLMLEMTDDRNRTVHTYHEPLAEAIFSKLPEYMNMMKNLSIRIRERQG
jgi:nucleotidyltransferase substrate binding protein (TIGR01987 family)